jgi:hypothetical protein
MNAIKKAVVGALAFCAAAAASPRAAAGGSFQGLGDLPGSVTRSVAYGISGDGSTVVGDSNATDARPGYEQHLPDRNPVTNYSRARASC